MKKTSVGRTSKGPRPIRVSNRGSAHANGAPDLRISSSGTNIEPKRKSNIPLPKVRGSSSDRDSRSRMRAIDLSSKKKRSRSHATPSTPAMQCLEAPVYLSSAQSTRSRSGSRCGSADRGFKSHKGKVTDTRPIKDSGFQHRAMIRVYNYCQRQPQAVREACPMPNTRSIMIKSFVDIMGHLLHQFFNNHGVYIKNYTEEIPKLMKKLHYPGTVSSSWLKTVNAPHAWAHVLAAMSWLVDLIVERENMSIDDFFPQAYDEETPDLDKKIIFKSILEGFTAWNENDNAKSDAIDCALRDALKANQGFTDDDLERLAKENEELLQRLNDPVEQRAIKEYENLVESVNTLALKEDQITRTSHQVEASVDAMKDKLKELQHQYGKLEKGLESKTNKRAQLAQIVATQSMSVDDAKAIKEESYNIRTEIKNSDAYLSELEKMKCADDMKMAGLKSKLNAMCVEFNKEILQSNVTDLHSLKVQTNLNFYERDLEKAILEMGEIDAGLEQLKAAYVEKVKSVDCSLKKKQHDSKELKAEEKKVRDKIRELVKEQSVKEKELKALEADVEKTGTNFNAEYSALKAKTEQLITSMPDVDGLNAELALSRAKETECQQDLEEMVKISCEFLRDEAQASTEYKRKILKNMQDARCDH